MDLQSSENSFTVDDELQKVKAKLHFNHGGTQELEVSVIAVIIWRSRLLLLFVAFTNFFIVRKCYPLYNIQPSVNAASYSLSLDPIDDHEDNDSLVMNTTAIQTDSLLMLKVSLPYRRLWNGTVLTHECEEHVVMNTTELSKKFFQSQ